jgi:hypothetical protein
MTSISVRENAAQYMSTVLSEVCFGDEDRYPLEPTIDLYFSPDYQQRTDGELVDREGFIEHMRALRTLVLTGQIEVLEVVVQGRQIADRHRVTIIKRDGSHSQVEVYLFGEFAEDGRLWRVDEVSRVIIGNAQDAALARTR